MRIVYRLQTDKKKRLWFLFGCFGIIFMIFGGAILFCVKHTEEESITPLIEYTENTRTYIEDGIIHTDEEKGWIQCRIDQETQFYDMDALILNFTENVWHEVIMEDAEGNIVDSDRIRRGRTVLDIPKTVRYLVFSLKKQEMDSLYPAGVLSKIGQVQKMENKSEFSGKQVAVLGDSLSAVSGYVSLDYWCAYPAGEVSVKEMWWYLAARELDLEISTVNACGGSGVSDYSWANERGIVPRQGRGSELSIWGISPDIVWVFLGGNDALGGADASVISENYMRMIREIQTSYPDSEIYLITYYPLNESYRDQINSLNRIICRLAERCGTGLLRLEDCGITWDTAEKYRIDDLHPDKEGMNTIAAGLVTEMRGTGRTAE